MLSRPALIFVVFVALASADFSASFKNFIIANYGQQRYDELARNDLGAAGSYGGGNHDGNSLTSEKAVVLVHGITNTAGTFAGQRQALINSGNWAEETVYGTTYGTGDPANPTATQTAMECGFVKQVRNLIIAVSQFTQQKVDVIGYSLGSPIARKAILGGDCVDTHESLGGNLTNIVGTYVSVAGANRGSSLCFLPIPKACNWNNGLNCLSKFHLNINGKEHYEGEKVYSIYGPNDDKVGAINTCLSRNSKIKGADAEYPDAEGNHDAILAGTIDLQMSLLEQHR